MSTIQVDRIIPYQSSSVLVEGLSAPNLATTGSNTFVGDQNIQGTLTASIQEGFALVGGVGNVSTLVATSSFGTQGNFATTGSNTFVGDQTITGVVTISGSANNDLVVQGRQLITGPATGQTPQLFISSSNINNTIDFRQYTIGTSGFDYPLFTAQHLNSSSLLVVYTNNLSQTASFNVGVFDNGFTQDVELFIDTTTTNGVQFKDIRSDNGAYTTFLKIAPNGGSNPPLEFKRSAEVTGSVNISQVLKLGAQDPLPANGVGQLAVSGSNLYYNDGSTWTQIN